MGGIKKRRENSIGLFTLFAHCLKASNVALASANVICKLTVRGASVTFRAKLRAQTMSVRDAEYFEILDLKV